MPFIPTYNTFCKIMEGLPQSGRPMIQDNVPLQQLRPLIILNDFQDTNFNTRPLFRFNLDAAGFWTTAINGQAPPGFDADPDWHIEIPTLNDLGLFVPVGVQIFPSGGVYRFVYVICYQWNPFA